MSTVIKILMCTFCLISTTGLLFAKSVAVITNKNNSATSIQKDALEKIYTGRDVDSFMPVDQVGAIKEVFYKEVTNKDIAQINQLWGHVEFVEKGTRPPEVGSDAAVINWVKKNNKGIGYVEKSAAGTDVKTLLIMDISAP
ncbi:MAG: hypothetical protein HQK53_11460 [Oligoflexia bacterium]|nr:hypothetical protein [Oligoflexia bacterium]